MNRENQPSPAEMGISQNNFNLLTRNIGDEKSPLSWQLARSENVDIIENLTEEERVKAKDLVKKRISDLLFETDIQEAVRLLVELSGPKDKYDEEIKLLANLENPNGNESRELRLLQKKDVVVKSLGLDQDEVKTIFESMIHKLYQHNRMINLEYTISNEYLKECFVTFIDDYFKEIDIKLENEARTDGDLEKDYEVLNEFATELENITKRTKGQIDCNEISERIRQKMKQIEQQNFNLNKK